MSVLITGAVGNVGCIVANICAQFGLKVIAHDRVRFEKNILELIGEKVEFVTGDFNDWAHLNEISKKYKIEGVINSAALSNVVQ